MLCPRCGNILDESETSCKNCGTKVKDIEVAADENQPIENVSVDVPVDVPVEDAVYQEDVNLEPVSQPELEATMYQEEPQYEQEQNYNYSSSTNPNNKILWIAIVLIVIVSVAIGGLMIKKMQGTGASNITAYTEEEAKKMEEKISQSTTVELYGYKLTIPSNYETRTDNLMVYSVDYKNKVSLVFTVMRNVGFNDVSTSPESFKTDLQKLGFQVETYNQKTVKGRKWLVYTGTLSDKGAEYDALYAISPIGTEDTTFHTTIINVGVRTKDSIFEELGEIIDKAEFTGKNINGGSNKGNNGGSEASSGDNGDNGSGNNNNNPGAVSA